MCTLSFFDELRAEVKRSPNEPYNNVESFLLREWGGRCTDRELVTMMANMKRAVLHHGRTQHHTTWFAARIGDVETYLLDERASQGEREHTKHRLIDSRLFTTKH